MVLKGSTDHKVMIDSSCKATASYYFPVSQYVNANFGSVHSGTGVLEEVRLAVTNGQTFGHQGETDMFHQHEKAEADHGNVQALTSMGRKYFWGYGGVARDVNLAREFFERAAALHDPEALYNLGVFYANGQGGVEIDPIKSIEYFKQAANATTSPFPKALHAVGLHYLHNPNEQNFTLAKEYFVKAAKLNNEDAFFALGTMYMNGQGTIAVDIPRTVAFITISASLGSFRAMNFMAHALFDSTSWLAQYGRETRLRYRNEAILGAMNITSFVDAHTATTNTVSNKQINNNHDDNITSNSSNTTVDIAEELLTPSAFFSSFHVFRVYLPDGTVVPLPYPLGSSEGSCEAALPILKFLAEMSYRTKDLTRKALAKYIEGDYLTAVDLYEEGGNLGIKAAQENAAYLYEKISTIECSSYNSSSLSSQSVIMNNNYSLISILHGNNNTGTNMNVYSKGYSSSNQDITTTTTSTTSSNNFCHKLMNSLSLRQWKRLSDVREARAMKKVAQSILLQNNSFYDINKTNQDAALLYYLSASQGDSESLLELGWMFYNGKYNHIPKDQELALHIFQAAYHIEQKSYHQLKHQYQITKNDSVLHSIDPLPYHIHYRRWYSSRTSTTYGFAPLLALIKYHIDDLYESVWNVNITGIL